VKTAVSAPVEQPSTNTAVIVNPGDLRRSRTAYLKCDSKARISVGVRRCPIEKHVLY
jgi:hypothetical protein